MSETIRILAEVDGDITTFKTLIRHPMETGQRSNETTGERIPAHFIRKVTVEHRGRVVMTALWGTGISENPYLSFKFKGAKLGDPVRLSWVDNKGVSDTLVAKIVKAD
ncbi:MAG: thiosulfate oxidation carrier complex protein SoxZ [Gammaproteobacteria bacterium]